jgi:aspartate-semialdehyde dehydrogenase
MAGTVGVAGATGALGKEIVSVLEQAPWKPEGLVPLASATTSTSFMEFRGEQVAVDDLRHASLDELDVLIVAMPADEAKAVVEAAHRAGVMVVDCSASQFEDLSTPLVLPWLPGDALEQPRAREVVAVPGSVATLVASVLSPLVRAGWRGRVSGTVMLPASHWGRQGIEELSKQVVALFNSGTPPRKVFEQGLAFDLLPLVGTVAASGWASSELRAMTEIARLVGVRAALSVIGVPLFSGVSADLRLEGGADWDADRVTRALTDSGMPVATGRKVPRPRKLDGVALPQVGRVRVEPGDTAVRLWTAMDNLRTVATAAVGVTGRLLRQSGADAPSDVPDDDDDD